MHNRSSPKWEFLKIAGTTKTLFQMANNLDDWASILRNPNLCRNQSMNIINKHTFFFSVVSTSMIQHFFRDPYSISPSRSPSFKNPTRRLRRVGHHSHLEGDELWDDCDPACRWPCHRPTEIVKQQRNPGENVLSMVSMVCEIWKPETKIYVHMKYVKISGFNFPWQTNPLNLLLDDIDWCIYRSIYGSICWYTHTCASSCTYIDICMCMCTCVK